MNFAPRVLHGVFYIFEQFYFRESDCKQSAISICAIDFEC